MHTKALAEFIINTPTKQIPAAVLDGSRHAIVDTLGCALAGSLEPIAHILNDWIADLGARPQASVWGSSLKTSPAEAAFANGTLSHALDFDDSLPSLHGHPSATIAPAALAVAEVVGASGADTLAAYALGLEVAGAIGRAIGPGHYVRGWHNTATVGTFAATAAAARLWKLNTEQLQIAWGLAASQMSGLVQNFGTMTKPFHAGHAARSGVLAAWMAHKGFTANPQIFDGASSIFSTYGTGDGQDLGSLIPSLGNPWQITAPGIYVKRWPCCYCNHRPVGGLLQLINEHNIQPDEVTAIEVGFVRGSDDALISTNPQTGLEGKFSIEYVAAATVLDRKLVLNTFTDAMVQRPAIRQLMSKTRRYRVDDPNFYTSKTGYTDIAITTTRGHFPMRVTEVSGSPQWPMTEEERQEKFMGCASLALGEQASATLLHELQRFATLPSLTTLVTAPITR